MKNVIIAIVVTALVSVTGTYLATKSCVKKCYTGSYDKQCDRYGDKASCAKWADHHQCCAHAKACCKAQKMHCAKGDSAMMAKCDSSYKKCCDQHKACKPGCEKPCCADKKETTSTEE